jgi:hypothetical protein
MQGFKPSSFFITISLVIHIFCTCAKQQKNLSTLFLAKFDAAQVLDFKQLKFCLPIKRFIGSRINPSDSVCQYSLIHKVIHSVCG